MVETSTFQLMIDDFIVDDDDLTIEATVPPVRRAVETTSRHFSTASTSAAARQPIELRDEMTDCDDFERVTTDECFDKLIRLRNDIANRLQLRSNATIFTDTALRSIAMYRPRGMYTAQHC